MKPPANHPPLFGMNDIPRARTDDPETSRIAARRLSTADTHCRAMLDAHSLTPGGLTDEQAAADAGIHQEGICWWHRASDLRALGLIAWVRHDNGNIVKRQGSNGRPVGVSAITDAGRRATNDCYGA